MNSASKNQQIEFEVFPKDNKSNYAYLSGIKGDSQTESTQINVVFSHQSVIIIFICAIMLLVASFSLGVEKGKLVSRSATTEEKEKIQDTATIASTTTIDPKQITDLAEKNQQTAVKQIETIKEVAKTTEASVAINANTQPSAGNYSIQVASVKSESAAKGLTETLAKKGISAFTRSSGKYTIVLAGNFSSKEEAQPSLKVLKKTYTDCFLRKI